MVPQSITQDERTGQIFQGTRPLLNLAPLERSLLRYFLANPQVFLTKTEIIANSWPEEIHRVGVSDDALYRLISSLRRKLQCDPFAHCNYIRNWRGSRDEPEGGYRFFPDGQTGTWVEAANGSRANQLPENDTQQLLEQLEQLIQNFKNGNGQSPNSVKLNGNRPTKDQQTEPLIQVYGNGRRITVAQKAVRVSELEFRCLRILAQRAGSTVDYDDLVKAVWESEHGDRNCIHKMVHRIRRKLGSHSNCLQTCYGEGYALQCAVFYADIPLQRVQHK